MLPVRATLSMERGTRKSGRGTTRRVHLFRVPRLDECSLIFILSRNPMAVPAPGFIRLAPPHHDCRTVPGRRLAVDQALIAGCGAAAYDADGLELVHHFGDAHQRGHRT